MKATLVTTLVLSGICSAQDTPRILLAVASHADTSIARHHQLAEMTKDFEETCPNVRIAVVQNHDPGKVDYVVALNRVQVGLFTQTYEMKVINKGTNSLVAARNRGKIRDGVTEFCNLIAADWQRPQQPQEPTPVAQQQPQQQVQQEQQQQESQAAQGQDQAGQGQDQGAPDQPQAEPQTIQLGQTTSQVKAALGNPDKIVNLGAKKIYVYKDLKVTFVGDKVSDVQ